MNAPSPAPPAFDVIVVGARCAGSPLATLLAQAGLRVCLLDRAAFPSDTPSTHVIQPSGVAILRSLGVLDRLLTLTRPIEAGTLAFDDLRIEFDDFAHLFDAPALSVRRLTLDAVLLDAAIEAGADVRTRVTVNGLLRSAGRVIGVQTTAGELRAPLVIGADGARSTVARLAGAAEYHCTGARRIFLWSYFEGVAEGAERLWLGSKGNNGFLASPTDADLFLAAYVAPIERWSELRADRSGGYEQGIALWPELASHLDGARRLGPVKMMSRWHGSFRQSAGPGWALLGDAGHFKDPTPGQGISDALRQGLALSEAIQTALGGADPDRPLRDWWAWRDRDAWQMYWLAQDIGSTEQAPTLLPAIMARIATDERLLEGLLRVMNHEVAPSKLFHPLLLASVLGEALLDGHGNRLELIGEARALATTELRRRALAATGARRPPYWESGRATWVETSEPSLARPPRSPAGARG